MNKVLLVGRLARNPELRKTPNDTSVAKFTLAVSKNYTNKDGEREADFINCISWKNQADNLVKYCQKGTLLSVEGRLSTRSYDAQDGTKRYVTEVVTENITFLSSNQQNNSNSTNATQTTTQPATQTLNEIAKEDDPFKEFANEVMINDNDLPFE